MRIDHGIGWSLNGFDLSGTDQNGVRWLVQDVENWDSPPASTGGVNPNALADGGRVEPTFLESHPMVIKGYLLAAGFPLRTGRALAKAAAAAFKASMPVRQVAPLVLSDGGMVCHRRVKQEGKPDVRMVSDYQFDISVQVVAPDARIFGGDGSTPYQFSATAFLPSTAGGLQAPFTVPFTIGATVVGNSVTVAASGDAPPPVLVRVNGPAVQPIIREELGGVMPLDISLNAGQWLDVDLDNRTIKINSTVNRRNLLRGPWITPRSGMVLSLDATVYNPATSMTVFWTDASY